DGPSLVLQHVLDSVELARTCIQDVIHVPAWRGSPQRNYPTTGIGTSQQFSGTFDSYVASVIARWQTQRRSQWARLSGDLAELGLTWRVEARLGEETRIELLVGRLPKPDAGGSTDLVNIADVGFGVSQSLPVVTALIVARPGQLVYVEEPEIHLHPRA